VSGKKKKTSSLFFWEWARGSVKNPSTFEVLYNIFKSKVLCARAEKLIKECERIEKVANSDITI